MSCVGCKDGAGFDLPITMAFQPIVNVSTQTVFAYEALVRGKDGAGAGQVLAQIADHNRYAFDQVCRTTAIELAAAVAYVTIAGLALVMSRAAISVALLAAGYALAALLDRRAALAGNAPRHFARLRPPQMLLGCAGLAGCWAWLMSG